MNHYIWSDTLIKGCEVKVHNNSAQMHDTLNCRPQLQLSVAMVHPGI